MSYNYIKDDIQSYDQNDIDCMLKYYKSVDIDELINKIYNITVVTLSDGNNGDTIPNLLENMQIGSETDDNSIYALLKYVYKEILEFPGYGNFEIINVLNPNSNTLALYSINIPTHIKNKGYFKKILDVLETRASNEGMYAAVGPIVTEEGETYIKPTLLRRGYRLVQPNMYVLDNP